MDSVQGQVIFVPNPLGRTRPRGAEPDTTSTRPPSMVRVAGR